MERKYHANIEGSFIEGEDFEKMARKRYGENWEKKLDGMPVGDRGQVDVKMVDGVESGIYEGPTGF